MNAIDERRLARIRWRCRRGMLENDLVLARFLEVHGRALTEDDVEKLDALLDMTDNALWDVLAGRVDPEPALTAFVARLRAVDAVQPGGKRGQVLLSGSIATDARDRDRKVESDPPLETASKDAR